METRIQGNLALTVPWDQIEEGAQDQIKTTLGMDCLKTLAIMPDVHQGYDLPIGGVALLDDHIWPGAVGYDIGCGMCHVNTGLYVRDLPSLLTVYARIRDMVPVGFAVNKKPLKAGKFPNGSGFVTLLDAVNHKASLQIGTLGGGNHFIELGVNSKGEVGITIHSGSRRPGWLIGDFYMRMSKGPIHLSDDLAQAYIKDMNWALDFALANRRRIMDSCLEALGIGPGLMINENHNHAEVTPAGVLHRKGATPAAKGQLGIIPANMRDGVYITEGLGNEEFLSSASHGAGRAMSRGKAKRSLDPVEFSSQMDGIITGDLDKLLDEAPGAYKPIDQVLAAQSGILVDIADHFKPILVIKG